MGAVRRRPWSGALNCRITDGKHPMTLIPRYQAAIMAKRAREQA